MEEACLRCLTTAEDWAPGRRQGFWRHLRPGRREASRPKNWPGRGRKCSGHTWARYLGRVHGAATYQSKLLHFSSSLSCSLLDTSWPSAAALAWLFTL